MCFGFAVIEKKDEGRTGRTEMLVGQKQSNRKLVVVNPPADGQKSTGQRMAKTFDPPPNA